MPGALGVLLGQWGGKPVSFRDQVTRISGVRSSYDEAAEVLVDV
ncbi:hypothetical protein [Streptomyces sp. b94]|nr:hypothetical protein [Streptomyces sp. b94]